MHTVFISLHIHCNKDLSISFNICIGFSRSENENIKKMTKHSKNILTFSTLFLFPATKRKPVGTQLVYWIALKGEKPLDVAFRTLPNTTESHSMYKRAHLISRDWRRHLAWNQEFHFILYCLSIRKLRKLFSTTFKWSQLVSVWQR